MSSVLPIAHFPLHNHNHFQAVALFNANQHQDAMSRIQQLADACPNEDILVCRVVEVSVTQSSLVSCVD
jgi:hypothetical protein